MVTAVIDAVIDALHRPPSPAGRDGLVETLVAFGARAVDCLDLALLTATHGPHQAALAAVLERVGPALPAGERGRLAVRLHIAIMRMTDAAAVEAVARALAAIRIADEAAPR